MIKHREWTDEELAELIKTEFAWNALVQPAHLEVTVIDGIATICGTVGSLAEKSVVMDAARSVSGVHDVLTDIEVSVPLGERRTDDQLAEVVRTTLEWDALVPEGNLQVDVVDGWVTLTGYTPTSTQREEAARAVRHLMWVHGVTNAISLQAPATTPTAIREVINDALQRRAAHQAKHIDVVVDGDSVTLTGQVPSERHRQALLGAVSHAPGVEIVCDGLTIWDAVTGREDQPLNDGA